MIKKSDRELAFTFFNEINIISQLSSNAFSRSLPSGLNQSQFTVLNWFSRVDSVATPGRLSTALMVTKGAMTNTLKKLAEKGFIVIIPDASSGRQKVVTMTPKGQKAHAASIKAATPMMNQVLGEVSSEQMKDQLATLQKVRRYLDENR